MGSNLHWLPAVPDWSSRLEGIEPSHPALFQRLREVAKTRLDFAQTLKLDRTLQRLLGAVPPSSLDTKPVRLAVLASSTVDHLLPGLRVGALRWGLHLTTFVGAYGQYMQELDEPSSKLHKFRPTTVLVALDAVSLLGAPNAALGRAASEVVVDAAIEQLRQIWRVVIGHWGGQVIQQTVLPQLPPLAGSNEHRLAGSQRCMVDRINARMREAADADGVDILAVDAQIAEDGLRAWHDPVLWHRGKLEIAPAAVPHYGDLVARLLAAKQGRSYKCLVLDLDNTLWGGVIGDDGLEGIVLGQGSALGEAFVAFQNYAKELSRRGVILAVCSKNDEATALAPFEKHPEMVLRRSDIACFVANWRDKPANLQSIARTLNIGTDSLVLADDNPFERNIVRGELPMVGVPELPDDPALYSHCIASAGYFEALNITSEDLQRSGQYQGNLQRELLRSSSTDLAGYLKSLEMKLVCGPFDAVSMQRVVQLINKTNQFNLTTRRYTEADVTALIKGQSSLTLQLRLIDKFGDNGIVAVVIGLPTCRSDEALRIDTWLMSCRVLGRQVEEATLNLVAGHAARIGAKLLIGEYRPTAKNGMVRDHYSGLGFSQVGESADGTTLWHRSLESFTQYDVPMEIQEHNRD